MLVVVIFNASMVSYDEILIEINAIFSLYKFYINN